MAEPAPPRRCRRYPGSLFKGPNLAEILAGAIGDTKREAQERGLTDDMVDAEFDDWRAERGD